MAPPGARPRNLSSLMRARLPVQLLKILQQAGTTADRQRVSVYAVGGFVRDLLLATPKSDVDVDLAVEGRGIHFAKTFAQRYKARVTTHARFGTATVTFADGRTLDVATTRTERYAHPAALPTVTPGSIRHDLGRRDFTINALAIRLNPSHFGELVDDGGGQDLRDKTIRVLHDRSFLDDPTRVFRALRFEQRLGFRLHRTTEFLVRDAARRHVIRRLSPSRLSDAILRVLSERDPGKVLARLAAFDLLQAIHPRLRWSPALARLLKKIGRAMAHHHQRHPDRPVQPWVVYGMALLSTLPQPAIEDTLTRLTWPRRQARVLRRFRQERDRLRRALRQRPRNNRSGATRRLRLLRLLRDLPDETRIVLMADTRSTTDARTLSALFAAAQHQHATPSVTGNDLNAMGLAPGPLYARILNQLLDARLDGTVTTDANERRLAGRLVRQHI